MMNKQNFMLTLNKWREEKNLARLIYRIIKFEEDESMLSHEQICNRAKSFIYTKQQLEDMKKQEAREIADYKFKMTKFYESKGCTNISWKYDDMTYYVKDKVYFTTFAKAIGEIESKYRKMIYHPQIQEAINIVLNAKWIEEIEVPFRYSGTGDIIKGKGYMKYKAIK